MDQIKQLFKKAADALPGNGRETPMYCIKDLKAETFDTPFFQPTHTHAIRLFKMEVNREDTRNPIFLYPDEYGLFYLGTFHTGTGEVKPELEQVASGTQVKNKV